MLWVHGSVDMMTVEDFRLKVAFMSSWLTTHYNGVMAMVTSMCNVYDSAKLLRFAALWGDWRFI